MRSLKITFTTIALVSFLASAAVAAPLSADPPPLPPATPFDADTANMTSGTTSSRGSVGAMSTTAPTPQVSYIAGANRLVQLQSPTCYGWAWVQPYTDTSFPGGNCPTNLYGVTAFGILEAYKLTGDPSYLTPLQNAADEMVSNSGIRSAADVLFLLDVDGVLPGSPTYKNAARDKYDARVGAYGSATGLAEYIRDARQGQGHENGIIPWDIGAWARAAAELDQTFPGNGYDTDADDIAQVLYQDTYQDNPGYFDLEDDKDSYWYTLGLTGLIDAFYASGTHLTEKNDLIDRLLSDQNLDGSFDYYYDIYPDWQTTAYAVMTLLRVGKTAKAQETAAWLSSEQDDNGGWHYSSSGNEYPEVDGECTTALARALPDPTFRVDLNDDGDYDDSYETWTPWPNYEPSTTMYFAGSLWTIDANGDGTSDEGVVIWGDRDATIEGNAVNPLLSQRGFNLDTAGGDVFPTWDPDTPDGDPNWPAIGSERYGFALTMGVGGIVLDMADERPSWSSYAPFERIPDGSEWAMNLWPWEWIGYDGTAIELLDWSWSGDGSGGEPDRFDLSVLLKETNQQWDDTWNEDHLALAHGCFLFESTVYEQDNQIVLSSNQWVLNEWAGEGKMTPVKCPEPTAITLASFTADAGVGSVTLDWETGTEVDNAGFNLYRATAPDGSYTKVNGALIAAQGDPVSGASYSFLDKGIAPGTYYYKLEDVDYYGVTTLHGPLSTTVLPRLRRPAFRPTAP